MNDNVKVSLTVKLYAGDVLIAEIDSAAIFSFALDYILKNEEGESE